ncbi:hypothetical protein AJ88_23560 [Mesorhizobium amorphae CCBAU 01583]|nr:hypothetical protein AJ88_23560 [Mesorhizobium amorphae CCBAU 01583]
MLVLISRTQSSSQTWLILARSFFCRAFRIAGTSAETTFEDRLNSGQRQIILNGTQLCGIKVH